MENIPKGKLIKRQTYEGKDEKTQGWVNFIIAIIVSIFIIAVMDNTLIPENSRSNQNFSRYISGALAIQLFPLLFGWIARKIGFLRRYWIAVYWLVLLLILITRGIFIYRNA